MADTDDTREKRLAYFRAYNAANREKRRAYMLVWQIENRDAIKTKRREARATRGEELNARNRVWRAANPERCAYNAHKMGAKKRNIPFLFTFEEWLAIWQKSGKFTHRGTRRGQYVMARFGDVGPYAANNVRICTNAENNSEGHSGRRASEATRKAMSETHKARWARHRGSLAP